MIRTFDESVKFLEKYIPTPIKKHPGKLGLERMEKLVQLMGNPQLAYPTIHVGGTSGKGSTSTIIASILSQKYKVGLHTSPHLVKITERIKIFFRNKKQITKYISGDISGSEFIDLVNYIKPFVVKLEKSDLGAPSYFELVTAMAFEYFKRKKVDIAVVEVGMGGTYDATNVVRPLVAVLTNVGLDHTEILGDTVKKIAGDKVGIIKKGIEMVSGVRQKSVVKIVESGIKSKESRLSLLGRDFSYKIKSVTEKGSVFDYFGDNGIKNLKLSMLGEFQVVNAALAIRTVELVNQSFIFSLPNFSDAQPHFDFCCSGPSISALGKHNFSSKGRSLKPASPAGRLAISDVRTGLKRAYIPGRMEIVGRKPLVILDGAHNQDKIRALVRSIRTIFPSKKITAVVAIKNDKNARSMLEILLSICKKAVFTRFKINADTGVIESYNHEMLYSQVKQLGYTIKTSIVDDPSEALKVTVAQAGKDDVIIVTGSLYLVGQVKKL
ncbi:bifunctional folylpolyglutamate synthase/dihydrofolate synthase [Patescibacteria group bacterium]|nr:bifunctional folylpolyglutamate synthase/dihydrofolate synthase [Patescibacteria group bacterium]MCL5797784.1 bifunctional folylpolyglutamate synthase/dihydrofolate synthase [Patescibacteria group bacterium]